MRAHAKGFGRFLATALLAVATGVASAASVDANYLPETDFSVYHTYRWVGIDDLPASDAITDQQIKRAVDKQLAAKGWTRTDAQDADTLVAYQLAVEERQQIHVYGGYGYGWGWGGPTSVSQSTTNYGTLTLDVYDPKSKMLVWRGTATDTLRKKVDPEKRQARIDKAMAKLLKKFPPQKQAKK